MITDEKGEVSLGAGKTKTVTVNVRRTDMRRTSARLTLPDTAAVLRVTLGRIAQGLATVSISGSARPRMAFIDDEGLLRPLLFLGDA